MRSSPKTCRSSTTSLNEIDRSELVIDVIEIAPAPCATHEKHSEHTRYITEHGTDMPEVSGWEWDQRRVPSCSTDTVTDHG